MAAATLPTWRRLIAPPAAKVRTSPASMSTQRRPSHRSDQTGSARQAQSPGRIGRGQVLREGYVAASRARRPPAKLTFWIYLLDLAQRAFQVAEIARAKRLDARSVVTIKRRDGVRAASILCFLWGAEPQPKMEGVHRVEGRVLLGVLVVHLRRFHAARSKHEQLFAEDASGAHLSLALVVGREVCLVPGDAKGAVRLLGDEQLELRVLGRMVDTDIHDLLVRSCGADVHLGFGPFEAVVGHGRLGAHHIEGGAVHRKGGRGCQGYNQQRQYRDNRQFPHLLRTPSFSASTRLLGSTYSPHRQRGSRMPVCGAGYARVAVSIARASFRPLLFRFLLDPLKLTRPHHLHPLLALPLSKRKPAPRITTIPSVAGCTTGSPFESLLRTCGYTSDLGLWI